MQVVVHQFDGVSTFQALPLAAGLLIASARRDPLLRSVADFQLRTARVDPEEAVPAAADVLAYSIYVWNERYTLEVARRARERHPQAFVVLGGPSVPRRPERAEAFLRDHPFVDALASPISPRPARRFSTELSMRCSSRASRRARPCWRPIAAAPSPAPSATGARPSPAR
jgi:hypothetical protein